MSVSDIVQNNLIVIVARLLEDNMTNPTQYFECLQSVNEWVKHLVSDEASLHTPYAAGVFKDSLCMSLLRNLSFGVRQRLIETLNKHAIIDIGRVVLNTSKTQSASEFPSMFRFFIGCDVPTMALRRKIFRRLRKLEGCMTRLLESINTDQVLATIPLTAFGSEWDVNEVRIGIASSRGYASMSKEDGKHSFRTISEGNGGPNDRVHAEIEDCRGTFLYKHQPYQDEAREQYNFQMDLPVVFLLQHKKTRKREAVHIPYTFMDLSLERKDFHTDLVSGRSVQYKLPYQMKTLVSLDLRAWAHRLACKGRPMSAVFFAFAVTEDTISSIHSLDRLCDACKERFPSPMREFDYLRNVLDENPIDLFMPLQFPSTVRGVRWCVDNKAGALTAFAHDFYAVLRLVADSIMASKVSQGGIINFIDSFTVEDL
jgi:hypothetical protein